MMQVAVKIDETVNQLKPIGATASQHFYAQTLKWDAEPGDNPVGIDQDYVDKIGNRPKIYVALESHATHFRSGQFVAVFGGEGKDIEGKQVQYLQPNVFSSIDRTGVDNSRYQSHQLFYLSGPTSDWRGKWGESTADEFPDITFACNERLSSPQFRNTKQVQFGVATWETIPLLTSPKLLFNHYIKDRYKDDLKIP